MAIQTNPFRPTRWEHHGDANPLIWFTPIAERLAQEKSTFVRGSRGSGKTTLLKSICWEDLLRNSSLRMQHTLNEFGNIGVYLRFPDHISSSMGLIDWPSIFPNAPRPELEFYSYFSLAVELSCLERALIACHELRHSGLMQLKAGEEIQVVRETFEEFPRLLAFVDRPPATFFETARLFREVVRRMNAACGRGLVGSFIDALPARQPNELLTFVATRLSRVAQLKMQGAGDHSPGFKFCLDDCEVLSIPQQRSINSLVRMAQFPVSWVVSSVGSFLESRSTYIPQQELTDADRRVVSLDNRRPKDFRDFCQAVAGLRLAYASPLEIGRSQTSKQRRVDTIFPLNDRLGLHDVNDIFRRVVRASTAPEAETLISAAKDVRAILADVSPKLIPAGSSPSDDWLPYYQAWLLLHWRGKEDSFSASFEVSAMAQLKTHARRMRYGNFQAWLRRKQVGALLHFSARLGFRKIPLAGMTVVISLADGSIRDFLEIMAEIYDEHMRDQKSDANEASRLEKFINSRTPIGVATQSAGIYRASEAYFEGIANRIDVEPSAVTRLIEGLGIYTALLQGNANDPTVMGSAERGIFVIRGVQREGSESAPATADRPADYVRETIRQAELAGYLRPVTTAREGAVEGVEAPASTAPAARTLAFRLHKRLAPHFEFSYRGAYEPVMVELEDLASLCLPTSRVAPRSWAIEMTQMEASSEGQLNLPFERDDDEF